MNTCKITGAHSDEVVVVKPMYSLRRTHQRPARGVDVVRRIKPSKLPVWLPRVWGVSVVKMTKPSKNAPRLDGVT